MVIIDSNIVTSTASDEICASFSCCIASTVTMTALGTDAFIIIVSSSTSSVTNMRRTSHTTNGHTISRRNAATYVSG